jgi:hypothetical protein
MKVRDTKDLIFAEGGEAMGKEKIKELLKELGFVCLEESRSIKMCGVLIWDVDNYEVWIEPAKPRKAFESFYTEGMTLVMEIPVGGFYTEVYRIVCCDLYLIEVRTGPYKEYFELWAYNKTDLELVAQRELSEGFIYLGSQFDLEEILPKLIKVLDPSIIKIY